MFGDRSRRILAALVEAITANDDQGQLEAEPAEHVQAIVESFDDWMSYTSPQLPWMMAAILRVLEWLPLFVIGAFSTMSSLSLARRVQYLDAVEHLRIGLLATAFIGVKIPLSMIAYEEGAGLALTGIDRPSLSSRRKLHVLAESAEAEP
jgi:hypothetical protein